MAASSCASYDQHKSIPGMHTALGFPVHDMDKLRLFDNNDNQIRYMGINVIFLFIVVFSCSC